MKLRVTVALLAGTLMLGGGPAYAQGKPASSVKQFKYKGGKIETGMLYTYVRTDPAGATTGSVLVYVPDKKRVEILRVSAGAGQLLSGEMNWDTFSLRSFELWREGKDGGRSRLATGTFSADTLSMTVEDPALYRGAPGATNFAVPLTQLPVHLYGLDFVTLALALRHFDPTGPATIGVLAENSKVSAESPNLVVPAGTVSVDFQEDVDRDGVPCAKYRLTGPFLGDQEGFLWLHKEKGYLQDAELPVAPSPDLPDVKITLKSAEKVPESDWPLRRRLEISGSLGGR